MAQDVQVEGHDGVTQVCALSSLSLLHAVHWLAAVTHAAQLESHCWHEEPLAKKPAAHVHVEPLSENGVEQDRHVVADEHVAQLFEQAKHRD